MPGETGAASRRGSFKSPESRRVSARDGSSKTITPSVSQSSVQSFGHLSCVTSSDSLATLKSQSKIGTKKSNLVKKQKDAKAIPKVAVASGTRSTIQSKQIHRERSDKGGQRGKVSGRKTYRRDNFLSSRRVTTETADFKKVLNSYDEDANALVEVQELSDSKSVSPPTVYINEISAGDESPTAAMHTSLPTLDTHGVRILKLKAPPPLVSESPIAPSGRDYTFFFFFTPLSSVFVCAFM